MPGGSSVLVVAGDLCLCGKVALVTAVPAISEFGRTSLTEDVICTKVSVQVIVPVATEKAVLAAATADQVSPTEPADEVVAQFGLNDICARGPLDRIIPVRSDDRCMFALAIRMRGARSDYARAQGDDSSTRMVADRLMTPPLRQRRVQRRTNSESGQNGCLGKPA